MGLDFRFHYNRSQDRIALSAADGDGRTVVLWMTRFLTARFLDALGAAISRTSPTVPLAPEHAPEVLGFEHEQALVQAQSDGRLKVVPGDLPIDPAPKLIETIQLSPLPGGQLRLSFQAKEAKLAVELGREALHVVHAQLRQLAQHAGWGLEVKAPWEGKAPPGSESAPRMTH